MAEPAAEKREDLPPATLEAEAGVVTQEKEAAAEGGGDGGGGGGGGEGEGEGEGGEGGGDGSDGAPPTAPPPSSSSAELFTPDKAAAPPAQEALAAPQGWQKKITSTKKGKKEICFVAPDGQEIKSKRALDQYLKSHAGGPVSADFDWSTGETPTRRSSRISSRTPPSFESPQRVAAKKRSSITASSPEGGSSQKRSRKKKDEQGEVETQPSSDTVGAAKDNEEIQAATVTKEDEETQGQDEKMEDVLEEEVVKSVEGNEVIIKDESVVEEIVTVKSDEVKVTEAEIVVEVTKTDELNTVTDEESKKISVDITCTSDDIIEKSNEVEQGDIEQNTIVTDETMNIEETQAPPGATTAGEVITKSSDEVKAEEDGITKTGDETKAETDAIIKIDDKINPEKEVIVTKDEGLKPQEEEEASITKADETKADDEGKKGEKASEDELTQNCPDAQKNITSPSAHAVST